MFADIFGSVLPKSSTCKINGLNEEIGSIFTADEKDGAIINWTLPDLLDGDQTYLTLATFFGGQRKRKYIRHVLGFVIDFDTPADTTVEDILNKYREIRLPLPDLIITSKTRGHYHSFNLFPEPLRIRNDLYREKDYRIHKLMVEVLGADAHAVGAERWVRRPTENTVYYDLDGRTSWEEFEKWFEAHRPLMESDRKIRKITYIGHISAQLGGNTSKYLLLKSAIETSGATVSAYVYGMQMSLLKRLV